MSSSSYAALEADGFTSFGLGGLGPTGEPWDGDLEELLTRYDPDLGTQARRLVTRHHAAQHHAAALVELDTQVADSPASATSASTVALLAQDRFALEHRAVTAEWVVASLQGELRELRAELDRRLQERDDLVARVERLGGRLRRIRSRARTYRRQRDRARAALAHDERRPWTRLLRVLRRGARRM